MADIENISLNNTVYAICDRSARDNQTPVNGTYTQGSGASSLLSVHVNELLTLKTVCLLAQISTNSTQWVTVCTTSVKPANVIVGVASCSVLGVSREVHWNTNGDIEIYVSNTDNGHTFALNIIGI